MDGKEFEFSALQQSDGGWHWLIAAPGKLVLSGDAPNETEAHNSVVTIAQALARLTAA
jgi:hypothetical protein